MVTPDEADTIKRSTELFKEHGWDINRTLFCKLKNKPRSYNYIYTHFKSWRNFKVICGEYNTTGALETEHVTENDEQFTEDYKSDTGTIESRSARITTVEQAIKHFEVDTDMWEIDRFVINKWEVAAKNENQKLEVKPLIQVKVWLKRRVPEALTLALDSVLEQIKIHAPKYPQIDRTQQRAAYGGGAPRKNLLEVSIFDLHLTKYAYKPETGQDYDTDIAEQQYIQAIKEIMTKTSSYNIDRILLPHGNDFLHVDNQFDLTAKGTPQDVDSRWHRGFEHGWKLTVQGIDMLRTVAPVDVLIIPGNHDWERSFYMGEVLAAWYRNCDDVTINNEPKSRKYFRYGVNLIGFTHGSNEKIDSLPLIMLTENKENIAGIKAFEWHIGHFHKKAEVKYNAGDTFNGISIRTVASLCAIDAWHYKKGFVGNLRFAEGFLWDYDNGFAGYVPSQILQPNE